MTEPTNNLQPLTKPGVASAEQGLVILDGPDGVAVTMIPDAAAKTGHSLIEAAAAAEAQAADRGAPH
ncbi:MAG: hypothetical protein ABW184_04225 [Sphingobium sp.]